MSSTSSQSEVMPISCHSKRSFLIVFWKGSISCQTVDFRLQHVTLIWKAYASALNLIFLETILMHPSRCQEVCWPITLNFLQHLRPCRMEKQFSKKLQKSYQLFFEIIKRLQGISSFTFLDLRGTQIPYVDMFVPKIKINHLHAYIIYLINHQRTIVKS